MKIYLLVSVAVFQWTMGVELPNPVWYETVDVAKSSMVGVEIQYPSENGIGRVGNALLLERRTENLFEEADLPSKDTKKWLMINGVNWQVSRSDVSGVKGMMVLPQAGILRQVVPDLVSQKLYCFSVYARANGGDQASVSMEWGGSENPNVKEFDLTRDWRRIWVYGKSLGGTGTPTLKCLKGQAEIERPQFEKGLSYPTSFIVKGPRGVSGLVWNSTGAAPLFDANQGSVSFWIKPNWGSETSDGGISFFAMYRDPSENWKTARSALVMNAWILDPNCSDWRYAINMMINDKEGKQQTMTVPLQGFKSDWHHMVLVWKLIEAGKGCLGLYIDGQQAVYNDHLSLQGMEGIKRVTLGQSGGGYLDGWLDEVKVFDRFLTYDMVCELFKGGVK